MIKHINIRNFRGIEWATMNLGQVTVITGDNGVGKSSLVEAIKRCFEGGYDASLVNDPTADGAARIRIGDAPIEKKPLPSTKAVVEIELSDGSRIKRVIDTKAATSSVECVSATGERLGGQGYVETLAPPESIDPLAFLSAPAKDRAKLVMEFLDVPYSEADFAFMPGGDWWMTHLFRAGRRLPCFDAIGNVERVCAERRTETNRQLKQLTATIENLRKSSPTINEESRDWQAEANEAERSYREIASAYKVELAEMRTKAESARSAAIEDRSVASREVEAWLRAEVAKLEAEAQRRKVEINQAYSATMETIRQSEVAAEATITSEHEPKLEAAKGKSEEAARNLKAYSESVGIRNHLTTIEQQHKEQLHESLSLDRAIEKLRELRLIKMQDVGIPGLEMRDGEVYYRGLKLDGINTAQQIEIAIQIITNLAKDLPFIIIDNAEHFGSMDDLVRALIGAGFQVVIAKVVAGEPLRVETVNS